MREVIHRNFNGLLNRRNLRIYIIESRKPAAHPCTRKPFLDVLK